MEVRRNATHVILLALLLASPLAVIPGITSFIEAEKIVVFAFFILGAFAYFFIQRMFDVRFELPRSGALYAFAFVAFAYFLSAIFSISPSTSFYGTLFDIETFALILLLFGTLYLSSTYLNSPTRAAYAYLTLSGTFALAAIAVLGHLAFDWSLTTRWYDLIALVGLTSLSSLCVFEFGPMGSPMRPISVVVLVVSAAVLLLSNFFIILVMTAVLIAAIVVLKYFVSRRVSIIGAVLTLVLILAAIFSGGSFWGRLVERVAPQPLDVRPSVGSTMSVVKGSFSHDPLLGAGPNLFSRRWVQYKDKLVNESPFWNIDFNSGVGHIPTSLVTTGLLGFIGWLAFLAVLLIRAIKAMRDVKASNQAAGLLLFASLGALFVWAYALFYTPSIMVLIIGVILAGINFNVPRAYNPTRRPLVMCALTLLCFGSVSLGYMYAQKLRALSYFEQGRFAEALSIDESPLYARSFALSEVENLRGMLASPQEQDESFAEEIVSTFTSAREAADLAVALDPSDYQNWAVAAVVYKEVVPIPVAGAYEESLKHYNKARELNPTTPIIPFEIARLHAMGGDTISAISELGSAVELKRDYSAAYIFASELALEGGDKESALRAAEAGAASSPENSQALFQYGYTLYKMDRPAEAVVALERALEFNPVYANAYYFLALSLDQLGEKEEALRNLEKVLELNPGNNEALRLINRIGGGG